MKTLHLFIPFMILLVQVTIWMPGCASGNQSLQRYQFDRLRMGARTIVTIYASDREDAIEAARAAFDRIAAIETSISDWQADSEVTRLKTLQAGVSRSISPELEFVLARSLEISRATDGAFDVTRGRLYDLWGEARQNGVPPGDEAVQDALAGSGWWMLKLDDSPGGPVLVSQSHETWLDFGAIGKGYAADEALALIRGQGLARAMVELGGDMALGESPPGQSGWRIAIPGSRVPLVLASCGIATSGGTEQFIEVNGQRLSHLLDPRNGMAVHDRGEITVIATTAIDADAWASVASVIGVEAARGLVAPGQGIRFFEPRRTATE